MAGATAAVAARRCHPFRTDAERKAASDAQHAGGGRGGLGDAAPAARYGHPAALAPGRW
eukprot:COSAG01_NODE_1652_length_9619_cov_9.589181_13_plen_59_part_00